MPALPASESAFSSCIASSSGELTCPRTHEEEERPCGKAVTCVPHDDPPPVSAFLSSNNSAHQLCSLRAMGAGASAAAAPPADAEGGAEPAEAPADAPADAPAEAGTSILDELAKITDAAKHRQKIIDFCLNGEEESSTMMPSEGWYVTNLDAMKSKIDDVIAVFPDGLEKPVCIFAFQFCSSDFCLLGTCATVPSWNHATLSQFLVLLQTVWVWCPLACDDDPTYRVVVAPRRPTYM